MPARLRIGRKLALALAVWLTTVSVAVVGLSSLSDLNRRAAALHADNIRTTETTSTLWGGLYEAEESAFQLLLAPSAAERSELEDELDETVPTVEGAIKARRRVSARVAAVLEPATGLAATMAATEGQEARESQAHAEATYRAARLRILVLSVDSVLVCLLIALALIRDVAEFADTMQLSETDGEAHDLLKRHLERTIRGSRVTVLNRNNSADRLEAATPVEPECPLYASLQGAKPRACLAVRFGRAHQGGPDREPLLRCQVCSGLPEATTCEPLLVSGQVIGSVLVDHPAGTEVGAPIRQAAGPGGGREGAGRDRGHRDDQPRPAGDGQLGGATLPDDCGAGSGRT